MATCLQKHPFQIEAEDRLAEINTKIFEIKKKIQLSEGQRKSHYEENEQQKKLNNNLIETLKQEIKLRLNDLRQAKAIIGEEEIQVKKYLNEVCPIGNKSSDQVIHNLDLKVIDQRKMLDLLRYELKKKRNQLKQLEKEYEHLLIESTKGELMKSKTNSATRKNVSHLENEIHKVLIQWTEAELVKKKYLSIRQALIDDSVKFESSLTHLEDMLNKQREEIKKLEYVREEAAVMRMRATVATSAEAARAQDADLNRAEERAYFNQRFEERKKELEKLEKRIFPPAPRVIRTESARSTEDGATEDATQAQQMEEVFQRLMKLTGVTDPEEVFDKFRAQRETSKRLNFLQQTTEEEKLKLEASQTTLMTELEVFKFASVKDKDESQDQINSLKEDIKQEEEKYAELQKKVEDLETLLMNIKGLLFGLCKLLDQVVPEPALPEWTAEARDVQQLLEVLTARYEAARTKVAEIHARRDEAIPLPLVIRTSNPTSGAASVVGVSVHSHNTPKEVDKLPTYKELVVKEPQRPPPSDEEDDIPSRFYLKRQAQVIVDTKTRRKGLRSFPRK